VLAGLEIGLALHIALLRSTVRRVTVIERDAPEAAVDTCDVPQPEAQEGRLFGMEAHFVSFFAPNRCKPQVMRPQFHV
jgi:hypothetical protein